MTSVDRADSRFLLLPPCGGVREGGNPERQPLGFPPPLTPHKGEGNDGVIPRREAADV
jgi:hypothetical protein